MEKIKKRVVKILDIPILNAGAETELKDCKLINLGDVEFLAITAKMVFNSAATAGAEIRLWSSVQGGDFDTDTYADWPTHFVAGAKTIYTRSVTPDPRYLKVSVKNLDTAQAISDIEVFACIGRRESQCDEK